MVQTGHGTLRNSFQKERSNFTPKHGWRAGNAVLGGTHRNTSVRAQGTFRHVCSAARRRARWNCDGNFGIATKFSCISIPAVGLRETRAAEGSRGRMFLFKETAMTQVGESNFPLAVPQMSAKLTLQQLQMGQRLKEGMSCAAA